MGKAIVTGSNGQDGSFMCDLLKSKGYKVFNLDRGNTHWLEEIMETEQPDEIYNFAGVSDVINPFYNVQELFEVNIGLPATLLNFIIKYSPKTKYFQASSCLTIGPIYPYGISKLAVDMLIKQYRKKFGIFACSGILFPHESERRANHFFSKKIIRAAVNKEIITVGPLDVFRDYGYAPDYMNAAWQMLQTEAPKDYQIGTGVVTSIRDFTETVFNECGLNYKDYITEDISNSRSEPIIRCDISPIFNDIGWKATHNINDIIKIMLAHEKIVVTG